MFDDVDLTVTALELDHHRSTFLHQANRIVQRLFGVGIAHERHVGNEKRTLQTPGHTAAVINDVVDGDRNRRVVALNDHTK